MKFRRLPPLAVLHSFELAASLLSFKEAAERLHVTPSAISHQMRALEQFVGQPLFRRLNRCLELTEAGATYLDEVRGALEALRDATDALRYGAGARPLTLSVGSFFGPEFLVPRLAQFEAENPDIHLRVFTEQVERDPRRGEVDLALRLVYRKERPRGLHMTLLTPVQALPVGGRQYAGAGVEALASAPLLQTSGLQNAWPNWFRWAGLDRESPRHGPQFDSYSALMAACESGAGIAFGLLPVIGSRLADGRLTALWHEATPSSFSYALLSRPEDARREEVQRVESWLHALVAELHTSVPARFATALRVAA